MSTKSKSIASSAKPPAAKSSSASNGTAALKKEIAALQKRISDLEVACAARLADLKAKKRI